MSSKLTAIAAVIAIIAVPIAVRGEPAPESGAARAKSTRRICTVTPTLGSRVNNVRRCRTADEVAAEKQEGRQVVERIQSFKATMCAPPRPAC